MRKPVLFMAAFLIASPPVSAENAEQRRERRERTCIAAEEAEQLVEELAAVRRLESGPLFDGLLRLRALPSAPDGFDQTAVWLGECECGDRASVAIAHLIFQEGAGAAAQLRIYRFRNGGNGRQLATADSTPVWTEEDECPGDPRRKLRRWSGLAVQRFPAYLRAIAHEEAQRYVEAARRGDGKACGAIIQESLVGASLTQAADVIETLQNGPKPVDFVRQIAFRAEGDNAAVTFEMLSAGVSRTEEATLRREGEGWVLGERPSSREEKTMQGVRALATAIEAYAVDHDTYPAAGSIEQLRPLLEPTYISRIPTADAWGTPLRYVVAEDHQSYSILSAGSDRRFQPPSGGRSGVVSSDQDLVYTDGTFVAWWEKSPNP